MVRPHHPLPDLIPNAPTLARRASLWAAVGNTVGVLTVLVGVAALWAGTHGVPLGYLLGTVVAVAGVTRIWYAWSCSSRSRDAAPNAGPPVPGGDDSRRGTAATDDRRPAQLVRTMPRAFARSCFRSVRDYPAVS